MKLIHDNSKHNQYLIKLANNAPDKIMISTFGVYCGITKNAVDVTTEYGYTCATRDIIEAMTINCTNINILVGISKYTSCKGDFRCHDCENKYIETIIRYLNHVEYFPMINWKYSLKSHIKAYLFYYKNASCGLVGGRNFTNSEWDDISVTINGETFIEISDYLDKAWDEAHPLVVDSADSLYDICLKNGISSKTIDKLVKG